ncbi:LOW QUALITY PROTEIN: lamin tail domain-containing protein 1 [Pelodytes ibericus]
MASISGYRASADIARRNSEKLQLQDIKERFQDYIQNVRSMRNQRNQTDGLSAVRHLEEELIAARTLYEEEIQNLRQKLDGLCKDQTQDGFSNHQSSLLATEYQLRLWELNRELLKKDDETGALQLVLAQKEAEIQTLRGAAISPSIQLDLAKQELAELHRHIKMAQEKYEEEFSQRLNLQNQILELTQHIENLNQNHSKDSHELRGRVSQSETLVLQMEEQLRNGSRNGPALMQTVQKIQEASEAEVKRLQNETESVYNQSLIEFQMRSNNDQAQLRQAQEENQRLSLRMGDLTAEVTSLEKKLISEQVENRTLIEKMDGERVRGFQHIRALEVRMEDLQDLLLAKMRELESFQNTNTSLRSELDALKSMLEEEERQATWMISSQLGPRSLHCQSLQSLIPESTKSSLLDSCEAFTPINTADTVNTRKTKSPTSAASYWNIPNSAEEKGNRQEPGRRPVSPPFLNAPSAEEGEAGDLHPEWRENVEIPKKTNKSSPGSDSYQKHATASALGNLQISDVQSNFVRIINCSPDVEEDLGGFILQQNVSGHPVSVYRFPPKIRVTANCTVTVWTGTAGAPHNPPSDLVWKDQQTFITQPRCTTILSSANGHAMAWYTPVPHRNPAAIDPYETSEERPRTSTHRKEERDLDTDPGPDNPLIHSQQEPMILRREKMPPLVLQPTSSPWTQSVSSPTHPDFTPSQSFQSRSQAAKTGARAGCVSVRNPSSGQSKGPTRSTGSNSRGVLYVGRSAPSGSVLDKFLANPLYNIRLASQVSLTPSIFSNV